MPPVKMYTTAVCPYCIRAKQILKSKGVDAIDEVRVDMDPQERFKMMERKLYFGIMMPSMALTAVFGLWLWLGYGITGGWLMAKLALVVVLIAHHFWLGQLMADFRRDANRHSHVFYRWINEIPAAPILFAVVILVVVKPF